MPTRVHLSGSADWQAETAADRVTLEGVPGTFVVRATDGRVTVETPAGTFAGVAAVRGDTIWIGFGEHVFEFAVRHGRRRSSAADENALSAPMPATVVRILVAPGAKVRAGDLLIALEAMKMELGIRAPRDAEVSAVHCQEGELVQPGRALVTL